MSRPSHPCGSPTAHPARTRQLLAAVLALLACILPAAASGLVKFDFEQKYFVHPQRQVWDFCLLKQEDEFHIFYHTILESTPGAANADTIWHATSNDLTRWTILDPVLTTGPDWWDGEAIWERRVRFFQLALTGLPG